ncbi:MAG: hypothetical protein ACI30N_03845 [Muribaculaceae bacterium]
MSTPDNELEKVVFDRNDRQDRPTVSGMTPGVAPGSLYIPPEESAAAECTASEAPAVAAPVATPVAAPVAEAEPDADTAPAETKTDAGTAPASVAEPRTSAADVDVLMADLADVISEMDIVRERLSVDESREIIRFCQERILECMTKYSSEVLGGETTFNSEIHAPSPFSIIPEGTPVKSCLRKGLRKNGVTLLKAVVEV